MLSGPTILVVDDEVDSCRNLVDIFSDQGFRVEMAEDGSSAMEKARSQHFDMALVDLMMPGMDGVELCEHLRRIQPELVGVLVTAFPHHPRVEAAQQNGRFSVLAKPVDMSRLLTTIQLATTRR